MTFYNFCLYHVVVRKILRKFEYLLNFIFITSICSSLSKKIINKKTKAMSDNEINEVNVRDNRPGSFSLSVFEKSDEKSEYLMVAHVRSYNYDNFNKWLAYVEQSNGWKETWPMKTTFTFPADKKEEVMKMMEDHNYVFRGEK